MCFIVEIQGNVHVNCSVVIAEVTVASLTLRVVAVFSNQQVSDVYSHVRDVLMYSLYVLCSCSVLVYSLYVLCSCSVLVYSLYVLCSCSAALCVMSA